MVELRSRIGAVLSKRLTTLAGLARRSRGSGHSLVLARPSYGERLVHGMGGERAGKEGSLAGGDSPVRDSLSGVVINEIRARSRAPELDFIECYNHSNEPADLSARF